MNHFFFLRFHSTGKRDQSCSLIQWILNILCILEGFCYLEDKWITSLQFSVFSNSEVLKIVWKTVVLLGSGGTLEGRAWCRGVTLLGLWCACLYSQLWQEEVTFIGYFNHNVLCYHRHKATWLWYHWTKGLKLWIQIKPHSKSGILWIFLFTLHKIREKSVWYGGSPKS